MERGFEVLRSRGVSAESELGFACLADLLRPYADAIEELSPPQAAAMRAALALGPPVRAAPFVVAAATLSMLAVRAQTVPLLVAVDDAQWVDAASLQALLFAARRLHADRVAFLFTCRRVVAAPDKQVAEGPDPFEGIETLDVPGLTIAAASRLVETRLGPRAPSPTVLAALHRATGGNPLALLELPAALSDAQLAGGVSLEDPLPVTPALHAVYVRRIEAHGDPIRRALLVAAASSDGLLSSVLGAMAALGVDREALMEGEEHGLVVIADDHVEFSHPILRSAAYHRASSSDQCAAHRALADALEGDVACQAWHRAASTVGPDEGVAAALCTAATECRRRGAHLTASRINQAAAGRTPDADTRALRLADAAINAHLGGAVGVAIGLLEQAVEAAQSTALEHELVEGLALMSLLDGRPDRATELAVGCADRIESNEPGTAARLLAVASFASMLAGDGRSAYALADRAERLALPVGGPVLAAAQAARAQAEVVRGQTSHGTVMLESSVPVLQACREQRGAYAMALDSMPLTLCWLERFDDARGLLDRRLAAARASGSPALYPFPLIVEAEIAFATGAWDASQLAALRAAELADQTGQRVHVSRALFLAARVDALRGDEDVCRSRVDEAMRRAGATIVSARLTAAETLGRLCFARGDLEGALMHFEPLVSELAHQGCGDPQHTGPLGEMAEALVRLGRRDAASTATGRLEEVAAATQRAWALGAADRCVALLAESTDDMIEHFKRALGWHSRSQNIFETARTELCFGEQLRRRKRRADAREHLRAALLTFEQLGATVWTKRARSELGLTAERVASRRESRPAALTTQERQVAGLVVGGGTNREVAGQLFISEKTVEYHLGSVYRKLGVRSRTQLAGLLGNDRRSN